MGARQSWAAAEIKSYSYRLRRSCFRPTTRPVRMTIRDGHPGPTKLGYRRLNTIEKLFDLIRANIRIDGLSVEYTTDLRLPRAMYFDPSFFISDEGTGYHLSGFRVLAGP